MMMLAEQLDRLFYSLPGRWAAAALSGLAAGVVPVSCVACGIPDCSLCGDCAGRIRRTTLHPYFAQEGADALPAAEVPAAAGGRDATADPFIPLSVLAAGIYAGGLAQTILAFKNAGHTDLAGFLAPVLADVVQAAAADAYRRTGVNDVVLVPVPGRGATRRKRGYVPLSMLLRRVRRRHLLPVGCRVAPLVSLTTGPHLTGALLKGLGVEGRRVGFIPQKGLGRSARSRNIKGTMTAGPPGRLDGVTCLVLDDVLTTGATIAETVRALRRAGAVVAGAAVIAATPAPSRNTSHIMPAVPGVLPTGGRNEIRRRE